MSLAQARAVALALPPDDRIALALELLESAEDGGPDDGWEAEIGRRVERLDRGEVELLDNADVLRRIGR